MNTCKAALRILWSHKLYLFIYMFGLGTLMLVMASSAITSADGQSGSTASLELVRPRIAVINTDGGKLGEGLSDYLAQTSHILPLSDDAQSLQDAVARNYVDLIVVIPSGYSQDFMSAAAAGERPPTVRTTVSYTSGSGSLAKINVDGYFSQVRTVLRSGQSQELSKAVDVVTKHIEDSPRNTSIDTVKTGDESGKSLANGFGLVMKLSIYPMFTAMTVCVSLLIGIFNTVETRRRLLAAPLKSVFLNVQQLLACLIIGLFCWLCYSVIALALVMPHNPGFSVVDAPSIRSAHSHAADIHTGVHSVRVHAGAVRNIDLGCERRCGGIGTCADVHFRCGLRPFGDARCDGGYRQAHTGVVVLDFRRPRFGNINRFRRRQ
jgi:ABC-2 type transport system permease protein